MLKAKRQEDKQIETHKSKLKTSKERKFSRLGFSADEARQVVAPLNLLLANYHIHYQKLRNFHWNIRGRDFYELHGVFENLYETVFSEIDVLAERIKIFGFRPLSNLQEYLDHSTITEQPDVPNSEEMAREIVKDFETLLSFMVDAIDAAAEVGDVATYNMIQHFIERLEKSHWMLASWLSNVQPLRLQKQ
jgi:starvation-inducible DNA-binding protein